MTWAAEIDMEEVRGKLEGTRVIRLALDSLEEGLPPGLMSGHLALELIVLRKKLAEMEREELRKIGHRDYMILAPVSCLDSSGDRAAAAAIRTLDELGLVIRLAD
jgi:hypothetical protein